MKPAVPTLLVTHRGLGRGLVDAAQAILGGAPEIDLLENEGRSAETLGSAVDTWLDGHPGPAIILTDLGFGSCCQAARLSSRDRPEVSVVAGVNLPMLLALFRSRDHDDLAGLLIHLEARGRESIQVYRGQDSP